MSIHLVISTLDGERSFPVQSPRTVIGRASRCDLMVPLPSVASQHCEIVVKSSGMIELKDLGSPSGTFHNGDRVDRAVLSHADRLTVGALTLELRVGDPAADGDAPDNGTADRG